MVFSIFKHSRDFVTKRQETILSAALVMMIATFATKLLGVVKIVLLANMFGATRALDIFYAANTIPEIVFNLLVLGSLNTALIPVLSECLSKKDSKKMLYVFNSVLSIACVILVILGLFGIIFAGGITYLLVHLHVTTPNPPFTTDELSTMTYMTRVLFISPIILGVSFLISGMLIVQKRFLITQVASVLYTLGFIISIFAFVPFMGPIGLCWGVVLGSVLHLAVQLPVMKFLGLHIEFVIDLKETFMHKIGKLMLPRVLGLAGEQLGNLVDTVLALGLNSGSLTAFRYAYTYYIFPVSLIGWSFAQAAFPTLAEEYNEGRMDSFRQNFLKSLQQILYIIFPLTVIFIVLRLPLVRLLGIGQDTQFGWNGTNVTAWVLLFFGADIVFQSVLSLLIRGFYAMQDTKTPVLASVFGLVLDIFLSIYLVTVFGRFDLNKDLLNNITHISYFFSGKTGSWTAIGGLAASASITSAITLVIMSWVFIKKVGAFNMREVFTPITKKIAATIAMAFVMYGVYKILDELMNTSRTIELLFLIAITCYIGVSVYILVTFLLKDEDITLIYRVVMRLRNILYAKKDIATSLEPVEGVHE